MSREDFVLCVLGLLTKQKRSTIVTVVLFLQGIFSLKKSYFEPRYLLLIPTQVEKFVNHLKSLKRYTPAQIDLAVQRVALYSNTNEQRPRFFDNIISCGKMQKEMYFFHCFLFHFKQV